MYQLTAQFSDMPSALLSTITESRMLASDGKFNPNFTSGKQHSFSAVTPQTLQHDVSVHPPVAKASSPFRTSLQTIRLTSHNSTNTFLFNAWHNPFEIQLRLNTPFIPAFLTPFPWVLHRWDSSKTNDLTHQLYKSLPFNTHLSFLTLK